MDKLKVTIIGQDIAKIVSEVFVSIGLNSIKGVSKGSLGNLKTLTYEFDISEEEIIGKRKRLMIELA